MDALEEREVATCDLLEFFLKTDMEGDILLRIDGALALLLVKIDRKRWKKHLRYKGKNSVIHVNCDKVIYGTGTAALLSYKKLVCHLMDCGFILNPYELCC